MLHNQQQQQQEKIPPPLPRIHVSMRADSIDENNEDPSSLAKTNTPPSEFTSLVKNHYSMPSWANEGVYSTNKTPCVLYSPGTAQNPLTFSGEHFKDILFRIDKDSFNLHYVFDSCTFERSDVLGDLANVTFKQCKKFGEVTQANKKVVMMPGTSENPLFFVERTFAYMDLHMNDGVHANFFKCIFISCIINGTDLNMQNCTFLKDGPYNEKEYAFYVHAKDTYYGDEVPIFGKVHANMLLEEENSTPPQPPPLPKKPPMIKRLSSRGFELLKQYWP